MQAYHLTKQELLVLDNVLAAYTNKNISDIRKTVQQSQGGDLTMEDIKISLRQGGLAVIAKGLEESLERGL